MKKAKWIEENPQNSDICRLIKCSECGFAHIVPYNVSFEDFVGYNTRNFCTRCGAWLWRDKHDPVLSLLFMVRNWKRKLLHGKGNGIDGQLRKASEYLQAFRHESD